MRNVLRSLLVLTLASSATLAAAGCSGDPEVRKRQFVESGDAYVAEGKLAEAIIEYRNAVQLDATYGEARKKLADAYARAGDGPRALQEFIRAADLLPEDVDTQVTAGALLLLARRTEDALARADAALRVDPENVDAHVLRGNALAGLRSFEEAIAAIEEAIRIDPERSSTFTQLGAVQMAGGRQAEAEAAFLKAVSMSPGTAAPHLALGNFYWSLGRRDETQQAFGEALELEPDNAVANRAMAALMTATGGDPEPYLLRLAASNEPTATFALTDHYLASGRAADAVTRLEALRESAPNVSAVSERLARAYFAAGNSEAASALARQVLAGNPGAVDTQILRGQLLLQEGKSAEALDTLQAAVAANPSSAEAQFALGRLHATRGDAAAAEEAFREVLRLNPRAAGAQVQIARLQAARGERQDSVRTAEQAARSLPDSVNARLTLIASLLSARDLTRAEREIDALSKAQPDLAAVHVHAGALALLRGNAVAARDAFGRAQAIDPGSVEALGGLIAADLRAGDAAGARSRLEANVTEQSSVPMLLLAARTYLDLKDPDAAERMLKAAVDRDPTNLRPYEMLGQIYLSQRRLDQARVEFENLAARQERPIWPLTMTGIILESMGERERAIQRYREVLAIDSRAAVAANNLAWIYAEAGENLEVALQLAQTATAESPDSPQILDTLGWVHYKRNQPAQAIPQFERAAALDPSQPAYQYHLGLAYLLAEDADRGRSALERALAGGLGGAMAQDARQRLGR